MTQSFASPQVVCRPALSRDYADIVEFCKGIWDGGDYVPYVWRHWFKDPNGTLVTAEYNGHAIGCGKLTLLAEGQWWLEGFRVDPNHQGLKVGSRIHNYLTDWWQERGDGTVRLMTSSQNFPVHHLCDKTGYAKTHEVCGYKAVPVDEPIDTVSLITDAQEAAALSLASESLQLTGGRIDLGWRICTLTEQVIKNYSTEKMGFTHIFHWWGDKQGLFSTWDDEEDDKRTLGVGPVACSLEDMPALLTDIRRLAGREKYDEVFHIIFDLPQIAHQMEAAGFVKHWDHNAFIFEKRHPVRA